MTIHVIGAGLAGLAAAIRLTRAGHEVTVHETAGHAGGRCRSFHDRTLDTVIDNGNHLVLSGNRSTLAYLNTIGAGDRLAGPQEAVFPFLDLGSGNRWQVRPNAGPVPWWVFDKARRVPGTSVGDYLSLARLAVSSPRGTVAEVLERDNPLFARFWEPLVLAVLNAQPDRAAASLLRPVLLETFARGGKACRPLIARTSLGDTFIDPALSWLRHNGTAIGFGSRMTRLEFAGNEVSALNVSGNRIPVAADDRIVLAVPAPVAADLVPELTVPREHSPIVNLHFRLPSAPVTDWPAPFLGLIGGTAQWLFLRGDIASVTISAAEQIVDEPADRIIALVWRDVATALGMDAAAPPPARVVKEKRATFTQEPGQLALRPGARTRFANLVLAGDWTDTGLPATIEGAIRSGFTAADAAISRR